MLRRLAFVLGIALLAARAEGLPADPEKLFAYGEARANGAEWKEADRAFAAYVKRFPQGPRAEQVHFLRARLLHWYTRRYAEARERFGLFCGLYPKSDRYWRARLLVAESYRTEGDNEKALAAYRAIARACPRRAERAEAADFVFRALDKQLQARVVGTATLGRRPVVRLQARNVKQVDVVVYRVAGSAVKEGVARGLRVPAAIHAVPAAQREEVDAFAVKLGGRRGAVSRAFELPVDETGFYVAALQHEGLTLSVAAVVARYGLVVKNSRGRVLLFAQERATGAPVPGMRIEAYFGKVAQTAVTDASGTAAVSGVGPVRVIGGKAGDFAFARDEARFDFAGSRYHVSTDRPLYRPGQKVHYKIVHRVAGKPQPGLRVAVSVTDPRGRRVHTGTAVCSAFGGCQGSFELGPEPALGAYRIRVRPVTETLEADEYEGRFVVEAYRPAAFDVDVALGREWYRPGDTLVADVEARTPSGRPVAGAAVAYRVVRTNVTATDETVRRARGKTDGKGRLRIEYKLPRAARDDMYTVIAEVEDAAGRRREASGWTLAMQNGAWCAVEVPAVAPRGDGLPVVVSVRDRALGPARGRAVRVRTFHRRWQDGNLIETPGAEAGRRTGKDGEARFTLPMPDAGAVRLEIKVRNGADVARLEHIVWIEAADWLGEETRWRGVQVVPDRDSYAPGDPATFLLGADVPNAAVLFTLEADGVLEHTVVRLTGHTGTVRMRLADACAPNVFACVTSLLGDRLLTRRRSVEVDPNRRFLDVSVERRQDAIEIRTRDHAGRPVAAEVALAVVDNALPVGGDITRFFTPARRAGTVTGSSLEFRDYAVGDADGDDGAGGDPGARRDPPAIADAAHRDFGETLLWLPAVRTNAAGRATVPLPKLPRDRRLWCAVARAAAGDGRVGQDETLFRAMRAVEVELRAPRYLVAGDSAVVTAVVHSGLAKRREIEVVLRGFGVALDGTAARKISVPPSGEKRVTWRVHAEQPGVARFEAHADAGDTSDSVRLQLPVRAYGRRRVVHARGNAAAPLVLELPPGAVRRTADLALSAADTPAATAFDALAYLAAHPNAGSEQTASRFVPALVVRGMLQERRTPRPELDARLSELVAEGRRRLYDTQHHDGGWGWWKFDRTDPYATAYVVHALARARAAGLPVRRRVLGRGIDVLARRLERPVDPRLRAYLLFALAAAGKHLPAVRDAAVAAIEELPAAHRAMLALTLHADGRAAEARRIVAGLPAEAPPDAAWMGGPVETAALVLQARVAVDPDDPAVARDVERLVALRTGHHWGTTRATAAAVLALADYMAHAGAKPSRAFVARINGRERPMTGIARPLWSELRTGRNEVVVRAPFVAAELAYVERVEAFAASTGPLRVARTFLFGGRTLAPGDKVPVGEEIEVVVTVTTDRARRHLLLEAPRPAGFEAMPGPAPRWRGRPWKNWFAHRRHGAEALEVAIAVLPAGTQTLRYRIRATTPGRYRVLPALLWEAYRPDSRANGAGFEIEVVE